MGYMEPKLSQESLKFFKDWRERYKWKGTDREDSEEKIFQLKDETLNALNENDEELLFDALIKIHDWKTGGRGKKKYGNSLEKNRDILEYLLNKLPSEDYLDFISELLDKLKIKHCNLPCASAQASFLLDRRTPVIDRFVAQFFSRKVSQKILKIKEHDMKKVLRETKPVRFKIQDDGTGRCKPRLNVYSPPPNTDVNYEKNRDLFVNEFIPELQRISKALNQNNIQYEGINGSNQEFTITDVEMATFAFGKQNEEYYQCFYEGSKIPTLKLESVGDFTSITKESTQSSEKRGFKKEYLGEIETDDGHLVKSRGEAMIDNWLYNHGYAHAYEKQLPKSKKNIHPDFYIPEGNCYIEYWGLEDKDYENTKELKKKAYEKHSVNLIEITNDDIKRLDDVLTEKLRPYVKGKSG